VQCHAMRRTIGAAALVRKGPKDTRRHVRNDQATWSANAPREISRDGRRNRRNLLCRWFLTSRPLRRDSIPGEGLIITCATASTVGLSSSRPKSGKAIIFMQVAQ